MLAWIFFIAVLVLLAVSNPTRKRFATSTILKIKDGARKIFAVTKKAADVNKDGKVNVVDAVDFAINVKSGATRVTRKVQVNTNRVKRKYGSKIKKTDQ